MYLFLVILLVVVQLCNGIIYELNDTDYDRMPPLFHLDDYHSCLHKYKSQYCVARWELFSDSPNDLFTLIKGYSDNALKHYNHTYIDRGVCLAKTCKRFINVKEQEGKHIKLAEVNTTLEACINTTIWNEYNLQAKLMHIYYCDEIKPEMKYDWSDWSLFAVLLVIVSLNIISSLLDVIKLEKYWKSKKDVYDDTSYLSCFSIFSNWRYMTSTVSKDDRLDRLKGLHGVRAVTSIIMPIAHATWLVAFPFTDNPRDYEKASDSVYYQLIFNGMMIVQIFFTMSGFLLVYNLQLYSKDIPSTWSLLPQTLIYRWLRLTPMNALVLFFSATWLRYLGNGPLWNLNVTSVSTDCRRFWLMHILYINNYVPEDRFCALHTWHLAADTQLFIFGVIFYILTKRVRKVIPLTLLLLLSMLLPALHVWYQDLDALVIFYPEFPRSFINDTYRYMHVQGHSNLSAFVIGMIAGYLAHYWQENEINVFRHRIWKYLTCGIVPTIVGLFLSGNIFYIEGERASIVTRMSYAALHRVAIGIVMAFAYLVLMFKAEDIQRPIFEWKGWAVPSRLSYCAYLIHVNIIHILLGMRTQLGHVSFFYVFVNYLGIVTLSFLIAVPCYLMVEAPFTRLMKTFFQRNIQSSKKTA